MSQDTGPRLAATVIVLSVLAYPLLALRIYIRLSTRAWGADDWSMLFAAIPFTALTISCLGGAFNGVGGHEAELGAAQTSVGLHWFFFFEVFYCIAIVPIKLSISLMEMRIATSKKSYVVALWVTSAMFIIMNIISLFVIIFHCDPISWAWDTTTPGGKCNSTSVLTNIYYADTAVNIFTDWFCALLPIPLLWSIQLNRNSKVSVVFLLSLGVLASLSACIRLKYTVNLNNAEDYIHGVGDIVIWGYAENGIGMVVGCLSTLRPLFRRVFHLGSSTPGASSKMNGTRSKVGRRNYVNCEAGYELPEGVRPADRDVVVKGGTVNETSIRDSDSEEHILSDYPGIKMTRSVLQETSFATNTTSGTSP
ncbi:hypothetical protein E4T42_07060 [Aureobasidium subglaciale]|uniref:Rhodopsin domain-containing protein n=1 Tax=Aureobasidium subglaciale (strain EXF-2481) TaxID=1043005 RepID=A0A074YHK3_AURSE|nr:uncharacterized protein AUEXF2481DRAFT_28990 [Aureobasidium subglaciale EXF-2481]KAI5196198.1 hypothetical protein E4T38_08663 [Aureobasidium subglaciale]KAI5215057.1 hypothetical protein E4T40_08676 [Aureobasidium subglaciale]KAI5218155.1 hypothetical protein E4T41_08530 [Aureobasidium subglaciale]KAI5244823.1 hypothetical protein E4T42_07060 [Aureobasidium subglaciale]KAI5255896.1 hypothetical protein E4T46_08564 [Aureobasidium subglaciale]